jgi:energy-coupling factor transport system ATP-binding protein
MPAPAVSIRGLSFTYRDGAVPALDDLNLEIAPGEFVVVMGATGAGKTTLAKCINRTIPCFQSGELRGEVRLLGEAIDGEGVSDVAGVVGLVSQDFEAQLFATNVRQEIAFGMEQLGVAPPEMEARLAEALDVVGLEGFEGRDPNTLSGGEKQRLSIGAVLALQPRIFVFDEPTTDLDPAGKAEIFSVLKNLRGRGFTILLIEHEIAAAEHADRLVLMSAGRIVADDSADNLLPQIARLRAAGVRPADFDRIGAALGWQGRARSLEDACARLPTRLQAPARTDEEPARQTILSVEDVTHEYDNGSAALRHVSLTIGAGELIALIGQNGSGKTTLAKHLNGLLHPTRGVVRLRGEDIRALPLNRVAADVGYVFQNPDHQIFAAAVWDEVAFGLRNFGVPAAEVESRVRRALDEVGLAGLEREDPFLLGKGQRQRLAVASLLVLEPTVLVLDEPTTGLDFAEQQRMMDLLRRLHGGGRTLVVITHSPWVVAEYAERGILMQGGRIRFDGALRELFGEEKLLTECRFRLPDVTRLGLARGLTALSVEELVDAARTAGGGLSSRSLPTDT